MRPKILFIGHSYHELTKSSEFFIEYLKAFGDVSIENDETWKLKKAIDYRPLIQPFDMVVVWQLPGAITNLADSGHPNLVYVPMYDAVHKIGGPFWKNLRKVKIVCFSATLRATCMTHGLHSYFIQYYPATSKDADVGYATNRLFFWQRRPFPNWQTLTSILPVSQFEKIHQHIVIDPGISNNSASKINPTPSEIQQKNFSQSTWFEKKNDLITKLNEFNLFFLPREREGIGFSFLDAMANGMVPIGFNFPTYSEYVVDGINGFIVDKDQRIDLPKLASIASNMRHYLQKGHINYQRSLEGLESFLFNPLPPTKLQGFALWRKFRGGSRRRNHYRKKRQPAWGRHRQRSVGAGNQSPFRLPDARSRRLHVTLIQRFSQWFNACHRRTGTLWEDRFNSVIVKSGIAARIMAAYIGLNPVPAGMVADPTDYRWSSYGEAVASGKKGNGKKARSGLIRTCFSDRQEILITKKSNEKWPEVSRIYRRLTGLALERKLGKTEVAGNGNPARNSEGQRSHNTAEMFASEENGTVMKDLSLAQLLHDDLEKTVGLADRLAEQKRAERLATLKEKMHQTNCSLTSFSKTLTKATQQGEILPLATVPPPRSKPLARILQLPNPSLSPLLTLNF